MKSKVLKYGIAAVLFAFVIVAFNVSMAKAESAEEKASRIAEEKKKEQMKESKEKLESTEWKIKLREMAAGEGAKEIEDTLRFTEGRISSDMLTKEGFSPTNFTIRIKREDHIILETMQTSEKSGVAFWRGEIRGKDQPMTGVLSWHVKENQIKDYSFASEGVGTKFTPAVEEEPVAPVASPAVVEEPAAIEETVTEEEVVVEEAATEEPAAVEETVVVEETVTEEPAQITEEAPVQQEEPVKEAPKKEEKKKRWW